jgi:arginase family enzyme
VTSDTELDGEAAPDSVTSLIRAPQRYISRLRDSARGAEATAEEWLAAGPTGSRFVFLGAPTSALSLCSSRADLTPPAFRKALGRFPVWDADNRVDLSMEMCHDAGDVEMRGDAIKARQRLRNRITELGRSPRTTVVVCGGDGSVTYAGVHGLAASRQVSLNSGKVGLLCFDAHHDLQPSSPRPSNASAVRELLEDGLPGSCIVQVGISRLGNSRGLTTVAEAAGVYAYGSSEMQRLSVRAAVEGALSRLKTSWIYVNFDIDVLDPTFAPACPMAMPGGLSPGELTEAAFQVGRDPRTAVADIVEVDADADVAAITLRAAAQVFLSFCCGVATRGRDVVPPPP